jgi:hypothetical protein
MYWTDYSGEHGVITPGDIRRADLDGTDMETLISGLNEPSGIAFSIPEPASLVLLGIGLVGVLGYAGSRAGV